VEEICNGCDVELKKGIWVWRWSKAFSLLELATGSAVERERGWRPQ